MHNPDNARYQGFFFRLGDVTQHLFCRLFKKLADNKEFLETDYPQGRAIAAFHWFHFDLKVKNEILLFRFPHLSAERQVRGNDILSETPTQSPPDWTGRHRGILFD